jgi:hypothetical protein
MSLIYEPRGKAGEYSDLAVIRSCHRQHHLQDGTYRFSPPCTAFPRKRMHVYARPCKPGGTAVNYGQIRTLLPLGGEPRNGSQAGSRGSESRLPLLM